MNIEKALKHPARRFGVLPGFGLSLGYTMLYLSLVVLVPLLALAIKPFDLGLNGFWDSVTSARALSALRLSFVTALAAAGFNAVMGTLLAWVLVRYRFRALRVIDALIDLPFALPTAVAGITLASLYAPKGWVGSVLAPYGIKVSYQPIGIWVALVFIGLPFVVRTVQPVLQDIDREVEEAASVLGASRLQAFSRVILPMLLPAILTGFALAFARGIGEYGSVIFIAGNRPLVSEIAPLLITIRLEQFDYAGAAALAAVMLILSLALLLMINLLQSWTRRWAKS